MKKIITLALLSLASLFSFKDVFINASAIQLPTGHVVSYAYDSQVGAYQTFHVGGKYHTLFSRSAIQTGSSYDYIGTAFGQGTPFKIYMEFQNSNTSWVNFPSGSATYVPTSSSGIGANTSTTGTVENKNRFEFRNNTTKAYYLLLETLVINRVYDIQTYNYSINEVQGSLIHTTSITPANITTAFSVAVILPFTNVIFYSRVTSSNVLFNHFAIYDIQTDLTTLENYYDAGYDDGYLNGLEEGYKEANIMNDASSGFLDIFTSIFGGIASIMSIRIFPSITLGTLIFFPIIFLVMLFIIRIMRGGS